MSSHVNSLHESICLSSPQVLPFSYENICYGFLSGLCESGCSSPLVGIHPISAAQCTSNSDCVCWAWQWAGCEGHWLVHWGEARPRDGMGRLELHPQFRTRSKGREAHTRKQPRQQGRQNSHYHVEMVHSPQNLPHTCFLSVTEPNWRQESGGRWERGTQLR